MKYLEVLYLQFGLKSFYSKAIDFVDPPIFNSNFCVFPVKLNEFAASQAQLREPETDFMSTRESLLRLDISCLDPHGSEIRKLRITLPITKTVQQLLQRIESHDGMEGCFYRYDRLRLKESGEWLHSDDVLLDILEPYETDFEAVPTDDGDDGDHFPIDTVQQQYIPRKEDRQDRRCNFLSCRVGSKMSIYESAHGWIYGADESGTRGFVPAWVFEAPDPEPHDQAPVPAETCRSHPRTRGVVKQIVAQTSGYVDKLTFHMRDGQEYVYGQGGHRECEYWLDPDEIIVSALQIEKESLGQIVLKTSKRELVFKGYFGPGKHFKQNFFESPPGQQIHHLEIKDSVLCDVHQVHLRRKRCRGDSKISVPRADGRKSICLRSKSR